MRRFRYFTTLAVLLSVAGTGLAQDGPQRRLGGSRGGFSQSGFPAVGDVLPDVSAYDADGKSFKLRSVKGKYTVLVFGCLT